MLLPAFFAYAFSTPRELLSRTGVFFLGLATSLVPLGMLAGTLGSWVTRYRFEVLAAAAILVILLGLLMLLGVPLPGPFRQGSLSNSPVYSVFALGTVYGLAGVCAGPMLGAALTLAAFGGNAVIGGLVLLVFAAGMVVPLLLLSLLWNRLPIVQKIVRPREVRIGKWRNTLTSIIGGALTICVGVLLLLTQGTTSVGGLLGATEQARLESWVMQATAEVPDWLTLGLFLTLAGAWCVVALSRKSRPRASR